MARPKKDRRGKTLTIYLTAERLDRLGDDPAAAIYALIDAQGPVKNPPPESIDPEIRKILGPPPRKGKSHIGLCTRCTRIGAPSCPECRRKSGTS